MKKLPTDPLYNSSRATWVAQFKAIAEDLKKKIEEKSISFTTEEIEQIQAIIKQIDLHLATLQQNSKPPFSDYKKSNNY